MEKHLSVIFSVWGGWGVGVWLYPASTPSFVVPLKIRGLLRGSTDLGNLDTDLSSSIKTGSHFILAVSFFFFALWWLWHTVGPPPVLPWWLWEALPAFISKATPRCKVFCFLFFFLLVFETWFTGPGGDVTVWERKEVWSCQLCYRPISWEYESQSKRRGFSDMTA